MLKLSAFARIAALGALGFVAACAIPQTSGVPAMPGGGNSPPVSGASDDAPAARASVRSNAAAPDALIGSDQNAILKIIGTPGLTRHERGVDVWQYTEGTCVLLMYFYDDKDGNKKLSYSEARAKAPGDTSLTPASCLAKQVRAFRSKDQG